MRSVQWPLAGIIFATALFFSIAISVPALNINDEWITVNQLHQLGVGHQVIFNEGKYGSFLSGEDTPYFLQRHNVLGYSLALPLISLPALLTFKILDEFFRLFVIFVASLSITSTGVLILHYYPQYSSLRGFRWPWILVSSGFVFFLGNLITFTPFIAKEPYPIEVAAAIFSEHCLFGVLAVILYLICREIFDDEWYSLLSTFSLLCCSSYLYWATTAKDHLLTVLVFSLIILFFLSYLRDQRNKNAAFSFIFAGVLLWVRPELGVTMNAGLFIFFIATQISDIHREVIHATFKGCVVMITSAIIGAIPFFLNNWIITGNPLVPIFIAYKEEFIGSNIEWSEVSTALNQRETLGVAEELQSLAPGHSLHPLNAILSHFTPHWDTLFRDTSLILLTPDSGMMGIIGISPLLLIGAALLPLVWVMKKSGFKAYEKRTILLCLFLMVIIFITYIKSFPGLLISEGIGPDMRYLTPVYIPAGILGLFSLYHTQIIRDWKKVFVQSILACSIGGPFIILLLLLLQPLGGGFVEYTYTLSMCSIFCAGFIIFLSLYSIYRSQRFRIGGILISITLIFPFSWQLMMVLLFSITKFNGYPFWMPILERLYEVMIIPVG